MKYLLVVLILPVVGLIIALIEARGKLDWKEYVRNILRSLTQGFACFLGRMIPKVDQTQEGDSKWTRIPMLAHEKVMSLVRMEMILEGVTYEKAYIPKEYDCENIACYMKAKYDLKFSRTYNTEGFGLPTSVRAFTKDDGQRHASFVVEVNGEDVWEEVYPKYPKQFKLSKLQIAESRPVIKG